MAANSIMGKFLSVFASELSRLDDFILSLQTNAVPGLAEDLLPEWEEMLGLPEPCFPPTTTIKQRQDAAHSKWTTQYTGMSEQFYIDLAASYGSTITITTGGGAGTPFLYNGTDLPSAANAETRFGPFSTPDDPRGRFWSVSQLHVWIVNIAGSDPNVDLVQCIFNKLKPAHTQVQFNIY